MLRIRSRIKLRSKAAIVAASTLITCLGIEMGARLLTERGPNGILRIRRIALLPYVADPSFAMQPLDQDGQVAYIAPDPELGWCVMPNARTLTSSSNAQGARGGPPGGYSRSVPLGTIRILSFGDSFTHCDDVADDETWQAHLEILRADIEAVNFGVPGYGTDQAYLRWRRESKHFDSTISMLCIWPEDICRNLNINRMYMTPFGSPLTKPRFVLANGTLELVGQPCLAYDAFIEAAIDPLSHELFRYDDWMHPQMVEWRPYYRSRALRFALSFSATLQRRSRRMDMYRDVDSTANDITVAICKAFAQESIRHGSRPVVVLIPMRELLDEFPGGNSPLPLVRALEANNIEVWDLSPSFASAVDLDALNPPKAHMSSAGNLLIAQEILARLPSTIR